MKSAIWFAYLLSFLALKVNGEADRERRDQWRPYNHWPMYKGGMGYPTMYKQMGRYYNTYSGYAPTGYLGNKKMAPWMGKGKGKSNMGKGNFKGKGYAKGKGNVFKKKRMFAKGKGQFKRKGKGKGKGKGVPQGCTQCSADCIGVEEFRLIDASNGRDLMEIQPSAVLNLGTLYQMYRATEFAIECITFGLNGVEVVSTFVASSQPIRLNNTDNTIPWTLSGDEGGIYNPTPFPQYPGAWTVTCQPYCGVNATGETSGPEQIDFTFELPQPTSSPTRRPTRAPTTSRPTLRPTTAFPTLSPTTARPTFPRTAGPTSSPTVDCSTCKRACLDPIDFYLVDTRVNGFDDPEGAKVQKIENGNVISLSALRQNLGQDANFTIICELGRPRPFVFESAGLRDNFASSGWHDLNVDNTTERYFNVENGEPYTLANDNSGVFNVTPFDEFVNEDWTVSCQLFCEEEIGWGFNFESNGRPNPAAIPFSSSEVSVNFRIVP